MKKSPKNKDIYILFQQKDFVRKKLRLSIIPFKDAFCMAIAALYMDLYSRFIKLSLPVSILLHFDSDKMLIIYHLIWIKCFTMIVNNKTQDNILSK